MDGGRVTPVLTAEESKNLPVASSSSSYILVNPLLFRKYPIIAYKVISKTIINNKKQNKPKYKCLYDRTKSIQHSVINHVL